MKVFVNENIIAKRYFTVSLNNVKPCIANQPGRLGRCGAIGDDIACANDPLRGDVQDFGLMQQGLGRLAVAVGATEYQDGGVNLPKIKNVHRFNVNRVRHCRTHHRAHRTPNKRDGSGEPDLWRCPGSCPVRIVGHRAAGYRRRLWHRSLPCGARSCAMWHTSCCRAKHPGYPSRLQ